MMIKFLIWFILLKFSLKLQILETYIIFTFIFLIFSNLGERKKNEMSAYSVFNKNH
jgi:hypothetical protein